MKSISQCHPACYNAIMKHAHSTDPQQIIKSARLRTTPGRLAIIGVLLKSPSPLTQEQIAAKLGNSGLNKVTIYRALESFLESGIIHRAFLKQRSWYYELAHNCSHSQCHPHFTCTACGRTLCLKTATVPMTSNLPPGYRVQRQKVELEGLCPDC
ncbi:MAG: hypothetical protein A2Y07_08970 [Planctomycetes bacterium GWF2_50_10]|nr:MAG: hypothetical protein A2Y07_08970 [Planctomycetes bacterium GWF2_50_10]